MTLPVKGHYWGAYAKFKKERDKQKLVMLVLPLGTTTWLGKGQRGLKDACFLPSTFTSLRLESTFERGRLEVAWK